MSASLLAVFVGGDDVIVKVFGCRVDDGDCGIALRYMRYSASFLSCRDIESGVVDKRRKRK